jgi:3',5'-cyclic AMP phosphodiesterase CpdA
MVRCDVLRVASIAIVACGGATRAPVAPVTSLLPPEGVARLIVGGDSRDDSSHVVPWAFREAKARGASAFVFLGDMELTPALDTHFARELPLLDPIPFYPVLGNHEVKIFGVIGVRRAEHERQFRDRFLAKPRTPVISSLANRVTYSVDLPGGVRFIALDNVSQKGFGDVQLTWLAHALEHARGDPSVRFIIVGMHKPLARNGVTRHSMDDDGARAIADSDAALALFQRYQVSLVVASHDHRYASFTQGKIRSYITGGLGAPLDRSQPDGAFHHFLQVDVGSELHVEVVRFTGAPSVGGEIDDD